MQRTADGRLRRTAVFAIALSAHLMIIQALLHVRIAQPSSPVLERMTLLYLAPPERATPVQAASGPTTVMHRGPRRPPDLPPPPAGVAAPGSPPVTAPPVNWTAEQARTADSNSREAWQQLSRRCRDAQALHIHPPECHRYVEPEPWEPEEKRFGLEGPLPYVRLGRCVVGLGFWGCAVGKPPPNGHLFDGMRDPDRPGSIPDNGRYIAPPDAREPLH